MKIGKHRSTKTGYYNTKMFSDAVVEKTEIKINNYLKQLKENEQFIDIKQSLISNRAFFTVITFVTETRKKERE